MPFLIVLAIGLWFLFGDPAKDVANWFWPDDAAPWETVDAFYYPDRSNLYVFQQKRDLESVQECRDWVWFTAAENNDSGLARGSYECAIEVVDELAGIPVYRTTVR